ncbi:MAG: VWA domain-containing protein [Candidatus Electryoneaceae bacterium]|nr:VWA domain-containing protein [Candidatus Electryoneaceae bacterium]
MAHLRDPYWLWAGLIIIPLVWLYIHRQRRRLASVLFSAVGIAKDVIRKRRSIKPYLRHISVTLTVIAVMLVVVGLSRPQAIHKGQDVYSEGIDIILVLDISASMLAMDFRPDRVGSAKVVAADFIRERPDDRIGIVLFAKHAFTQCPLTLDHTTLIGLVDSVKVGMSDPDNTAIGQALGSALNRLKDSDAKSKVVILLTDGENNFGLPPMTAAEAAAALGIRVYTIGVGKRGTAPYPASDMFGRRVTQQIPVSIDEDLLRSIAEMTSGQYFRATNNDKLSRIFGEIDQMEKSLIQVTAYKRYSEMFYPWVLGSLIAIMLALIVAVVARGVV